MNAWRRLLLLGVWYCALCWPFVHAGVYRHPALLGLLGLFLSVGELWRHWVWRWLHRLLVLYGELSLAWDHWVTLHWLRLIVHTSLYRLLALPVSRWNQIHAHIAAPLLLLATFIGWLFVAGLSTYGQATAWYIAGTFVIVVSHILWKLPAELALAGYLTLGLVVLADFHQDSLSHNAHRAALTWRDYPLWGMIFLLPLVLGWQMPARPPVNPLNILRHTALASRQRSATTGYGPGVTEIGHSLLRSRALEFVVHTTHPYYWQAATYTYFNGNRWSNPGSGLSYVATPTDSALPLVNPYYQSHVPTVTMTTLITDLAPQDFTTLFYTGVPTRFSVPVTVHTRSDHIVARGVWQYLLHAKVPIYRLSALQSARFAAPPPTLAPDLQVPRNLSFRVHRLAKRLTQTATGPWEAALLVKQYLDSHYQYSLTIPPPHGNVVNQFLFSSKKGYCDQFSTAFIMMMRTLHIPARWVVGYDSGTFQPARHDYVIRAFDAHAWAQIWIAHLGWVPFDPTPGFSSPIAVDSSLSSQAILLRQHLVPTAPDTPSVHLPALAQNLTTTVAHSRQRSSRQRSQFKPSKASRVVLVLLLAGMMLGAIGGLLWWNRRQSTPDLVWRKLQQISRRRLRGSEHNKTPRQWGREWLQFFPDDGPVIWPLVQLLEAAFYSQKALSEKEQEQLIALWRQLRHNPR
ncbi:MAG: hypothetical protein C7B45_08455 [Sulfobacillus acidophilus]|uniref:Transglutaminase-like domain-containing protein n=1 Tax=Sulfobacillus acidophilus TaxID=53633 RepID=A0A2T2WIE7_9FIRM|nr:MAG: hypothetical protein C7B45_08455 [Sulfobacillus acidophilus]